MIWLRLLVGYIVIMTFDWLISSFAGRQVTTSESLAIAFAGLVVGISQQLKVRGQSDRH